MIPPTAPQPQRGEAAPPPNDPETAEEVREALAIAQAEARALESALACAAEERASVARVLHELASHIEEFLSTSPENLAAAVLLLTSVDLHARGLALRLSSPFDREKTG